MGFGVWGLGFGVWGLGFGVWGLGFGVWGLGFGVWGLGFGALEGLLGRQGSGYLHGSCFRLWVPTMRKLGAQSFESFSALSPKPWKAIAFEDRAQAHDAIDR